MLCALVQSRRDRRAAERLMRKLIRKQARNPRVLVTDKLGSYGAARRSLGLTIEPPAQGAQQSRRKFASADAATRADHEAVQIRPTRSAVRLNSRSNRQPVPLPSPQPDLSRISNASVRCDDGVAGSCPRPHRRMTNPARCTFTGRKPANVTVPYRYK